MPRLTPEEVRRFVERGRAGRQAQRQGNVWLAEAAFLAQINIFPGNWEPYLDMARLEAGRGAGEPALRYLRAAVIRGLRDLRAVERSEAWAGIGRPRAGSVS